MSSSENQDDQSVVARFDLSQFTNDLIGDLHKLRDGKISVRDAQARAALAKQVMRAVHYYITAQKFLAQQAKLVNGKGEHEDGQG